MSLSRFAAPRASWWRRLWHRDVASRLDLQERRLALLGLYPWGTWERRTLALAMRAEEDRAKTLDDRFVAAVAAGDLRMRLELRGRQIARATGVLVVAERINREVYEASRGGTR